MFSVNQALTLINESRFLTGVTSGKTVSEGTHTSYANTNIKLKPWAPAQVGHNASKTIFGDVTFGFFRRARYGNEVSFDVDSLFIVDESVLDFEADIYIDSTETTLLASITTTISSNGSVIDVNAGTVLYTALDQIADGHTPSTDFYAKVYQISTRVGRGYAGTATISASTIGIAIEVPKADLALQTFATNLSRTENITVPVSNLALTTVVPIVTNVYIEVPAADLTLDEQTAMVSVFISVPKTSLTLTTFAPLVA